jgi:hypothetical protein
MAATVEIHNEVRGDPLPTRWQLCFQKVTYHYDPTQRPENVSGDEEGFRFIFRKPNGTMLPALGQARIPDADALIELLRKAKAAGWFKAADGEFA